MLPFAMLFSARDSSSEDALHDTTDFSIRDDDDDGWLLDGR